MAPMFESFRGTDAGANASSPARLAGAQLSRRSLLFLGGAGLAAPLVAGSSSAPSPAPPAW